MADLRAITGLLRADVISMQIPQPKNNTAPPSLPQVSGSADCVMAGLRAITGLLRADVIGMQIASGGFRAMPMQSMMAPPMPPQQRATVPPPRKLTQLTGQQGSL
jgi:hypothetical protein